MDLDRLRELRNRIHIQFDDKPLNVSRDDHKAFSDATVGWALTLGISVLRYISQTYPRPNGLGVYAHEIEIPTP